MLQVWIKQANAVISETLDTEFYTLYGDVSQVCTGGSGKWAAAVPCNYWNSDFSSRAWRRTKNAKELPQLSSTSRNVLTGSWSKADCWFSTNLSSGCCTRGAQLLPSVGWEGVCTKTGLGPDSLSWPVSLPLAQVTPLGCCSGTAWKCQSLGLSSSLLISTVLL